MRTGWPNASLLPLLPPPPSLPFPLVASLPPPSSLLIRALPRRPSLLPPFPLPLPALCLPLPPGCPPSPPYQKSVSQCPVAPVFAT